jgi:hypothetical protein
MGHLNATDVLYKLGSHRLRIQLLKHLRFWLCFGGGFPKKDRPPVINNTGSPQLRRLQRMREVADIYRRSRLLNILIENSPYRCMIMIVAKQICTRNLKNRSHCHLLFKKDGGFLTFLSCSQWFGADLFPSAQAQFLLQIIHSKHFLHT